MCRSDDRSLGQHLEQTIAVETSLLPERNGFGNRLHSDAEQAVHHKLHDRSGAIWSQIKIAPRDRPENRRGSVKASPVSASEQNQGSLLGNRSATRHGHVEEVNSTLGT